MTGIGPATTHYEVGIISFGKVGYNLPLTFPTVLSTDYDSDCYNLPPNHPEN